jgi:hypothetical protein
LRFSWRGELQSTCQPLAIIGLPRFRVFLGSRVSKFRHKESVVVLVRTSRDIINACGG